ncbi:F-box protein At2g26850-like [Typha angustifolia]|uniref:F-box protein At2g26850-like n=1 Tax=Typha angustifolia TaxID=59011 RepID=UPI003C2B2708
MLLFFISLSCFLLLLITNPLPLQKTLPSWVHEMMVVCLLLVQELLSSLWHSLFSSQFLDCSSQMSTKWKCSPKVGEVLGVEIREANRILDLPELALECILEKLSPAALANMACVCRSLRDRCRSDHLWERHMREKWSPVVGEAARREWERYSAPRKDSTAATDGDVEISTPKDWMELLSCFWPLSWFSSKVDDTRSKSKSDLQLDSIISWYVALESGKFWFPAQVYNRENGHTGFLLSCYDAHLSYDRKTNTFYARYPPHGQKPVKMEDGIQWDRLRASPVNTPAHDLYVSDCLNDLCPGDHFEIQWRRNKEFPYGWWYGVVGHLESCDGNEHHCHCHENDTIILEFNHYTPGSRWRRASVSRKDHQEKGDETDGFYGGIRKLHREEEISKWRRLWPTEVFE